MAAKPLTTEAIAMTEKKMDMTLDDIIKLSKSPPTKAKKLQRTTNRSKPFNTVSKEKSPNVRQFMNSRSFVKQGVLAQRRSNFHGNQFPLAAEAAQKAADFSHHNRTVGYRSTANVVKPRFGVQWRPANRVVPAKLEEPEQEEQKYFQPKQKPQTLDSLFANMKEQRLRAFSRQNNDADRQCNRGGLHIPPWQRRWFGN